MASSKEFVGFVTEQCEGLSARAMMGDYVIYYCGKVVGGIYDNRLLIKPTTTAKKLLPTAEFHTPYESAKPMLQLENIEDREFMKNLFDGIYGELPEPKANKR